MARAHGGVAPPSASDAARAPGRRVRNALDTLVREFEGMRHAAHPSAAGALTARLTDAVTGLHTSWNTLKVLSRAAGKLAAQPATTIRAGHAANLGRELARSPRYQLGDPLGVGGMAEVFRGWQIGERGFERPVAIKRMRPELALNDWYRARFTEEASIIARLSHPNVVAALDFVDDNGELLLVLEYVDGIDLGKLIASGPVPPSVILFLAAELLSGLGYTHHLPANGSRALGVVHCDLSPRNILLSWDGAVKIADFGISSLRIRTEVSGPLHANGVPGFVSPEQHRGHPLDGRADLFSLGAILWEMLAGEPLFAREQSATAIERMLARPLPRPSALRPVPRDLERVVMKLLQRQRSRRYRTAEDAFDALATCEDASALRGRAELVELLAQRFPAQAARRPSRRVPLPHTPPTPMLPRPIGATPATLGERYRWWMRRRRWYRRRQRWDLQRRRARRLARRWRPWIAVAAVCVVLVLGFVVHAVV
jgi:eukaryotic-like serine/threonine-protein kinase